MIKIPTWKRVAAFLIAFLLPTMLYVLFINDLFAAFGAAGALGFFALRGEYPNSL